MSIATAWSATILLRREFSASSSFRRLIASAFMPHSGFSSDRRSPRLCRVCWRARGQKPLRLVRPPPGGLELADDLLWRVPLVHRESSFYPYRGASDSPSNWISFRGAGHSTHILLYDLDANELAISASRCCMLRGLRNLLPSTRETAIGVSEGYVVSTRPQLYRRLGVSFEELIHR